jgi:hypothetical protein
MKEIQITINSLNLDYVKEKIEKFNNKALKLNKKTLEVSYSESYVDATDEDNIKELIDVTIVQQEDLIIENYKIIAKIDHTYPVKNFVKPFVDITAEQESKWQLVDSYCGHCNTHRRRNVTFMLQHIETLEYIQVGNSCLKNFIGHDIEEKLKYFDLLEELQLDIFNFNKEARKISFFKMEEVLGIVQSEIKKNGYKSSRAKYEYEIDKTTADDVRWIINDRYSNIDESKRCLPRVTDEQREEFKNVIQYIQDYDLSNEREGIQDFYNSLKNVLKYDYCKITDVGLLATLFVVYDKLKAKERMEQQKGVSQYVGAEGDKIEVSVTLEAIFGYETQYGYMHINLFRDADGNIYKWCSKNVLELTKEEFKTIKATIKGHEEYKNQRQTILTRCKIVNK